MSKKVNKEYVVDNYIKPYFNKTLCLFTISSKLDIEEQIKLFNQEYKKFFGKDLVKIFGKKNYKQIFKNNKEIKIKNFKNEIVPIIKNSIKNIFTNLGINQISNQYNINSENILATILKIKDLPNTVGDFSYLSLTDIMHICCDYDNLNNYLDGNMKQDDRINTLYFIRSFIEKAKSSNQIVNHNGIEIDNKDY